MHRISADAGRSCAPLVMSHSRPFRPTSSFRSHFQFHVTSSLDPCKNGGGNHLSRLSVCHFLHMKYVESIYNVSKISKMSHLNLCAKNQQRHKTDRINRFSVHCDPKTFSQKGARCSEICMARPGKSHIRKSATKYFLR